VLGLLSAELRVDCCTGFRRVTLIDSENFDSRELSRPLLA
jgi:hypothetical protein